MIFESLYEASQRNELMLVEDGFCNWHLRQDGQLTIREIISTRRGAGVRMLERLKRTPGATSLFAKCPADLASNSWYKARGFELEKTETTKGNRLLNHWRLVLERKAFPNVAGGIELIHCGAGNKRFAEIAIDAGLHYGAQLPNTIYYQPYFVDQDWKNPNRAAYMAELERYTPRMATVRDWDEDTTYDEVMSWAEEASQYVQVVVIIPKITGTIHGIPDSINGKPIRLGYSVPTAYGKTDVPPSEFGDREVHLLGGSPEKQLELAQYLNVASADGNYLQKMATSYCQYFAPVSVVNSRNRQYPTLREAGIGGGTDAIYRAYALSCRNWLAAWNERDTRRLPFPAEQMRMFA